MQAPVPVAVVNEQMPPAKRLAPLESQLQLSALQLMNQRAAAGANQSEMVRAEKAFLISNEEGNNEFADCYFPLRTNLPPGAHGLYKVTINEIMFNCTQPAFIPTDYLRFKFEAIGIEGPVECKISCVRDVYPESIAIGLALFADAQNFVVDNGFELVVQGDANDQLTLWRGGDMWFTFDFSAATNNQITLRNNHISTLQVEMSGGFYHFFNYPSQYITFGSGQSRIFRGVYFNGPIFYLAETGARPTVNTRNNANHQFNAVGIFYNYNTEFRSFVQMSGTMQLIMSNVSNFRLRIVDDAGRVVRLRSPVFCHLTIEPNT